MRRYDIPPVWMLGALVLVVVLRPSGPLPGLVVILAGIGLTAVGGLLVRAATRAFRSHGTTGAPGATPSALVTTGIFAFTRNPIYLAELLIVAGAALALGSPVGLVLVPALAVILEWRFIRPEEARIAAKFGPEWAAYRGRTRRWF
jgi:protein-S-isoprenylcysteine O-methyltransferase Ste14